MHYIYHSCALLRLGHTRLLALYNVSCPSTRPTLRATERVPGCNAQCRVHSHRTLERDHPLRMHRRWLHWTLAGAHLEVLTYAVPLCAIPLTRVHLACSDRGVLGIPPAPVGRLQATDRASFHFIPPRSDRYGPIILLARLLHHVERRKGTVACAIHRCHVCALLPITHCPNSTNPLHDRTP